MSLDREATRSESMGANGGAEAGGPSPGKSTRVDAIAGGAPAAGKSSFAVDSLRDAVKAHNAGAARASFFMIPPESRVEVRYDTKLLHQIVELDAVLGVEVLKALDAWAILLAIASDPARQRALRPVIVAQWNWLMNAVPKPVTSQTHVDTILQLYGDGGGIALADKYLTWSALYRSQLAQSGQTRALTWTIPAVAASATHPGSQQWNWADTYFAQNPGDTAMNLFFHQFRQLPRAHVDTAAGVMMVNFHRISATDATNPANTWYDSGGGGAASPVPVDLPLSTSLYFPDNWIVMQSVSATSGAASTDRIGTWGNTANNGMAVNTPGVDPLSGGTVQPMTMFQNHATHEVGHAVGARTLQRDSYNVSGDDWTMQYGNWAQNGSSDGYAEMCGWNSLWDAASYPVTDLTTNAVHTLSGRDIKAFLVGLVQFGKSFTHPIANMFGGVDAALRLFLDHPMLKASLLVWNVQSLSMLGNMPDMSYTISWGIDPGAAKVHFFCTRWGNVWVTYDADCWRNKVSHYGVSSHKEMFAELYTAKFTGGGLPRAHNSHDPAAFFRALEQANPGELGLPSYAGAAPAARAGVSQAGAPSPQQSGPQGAAGAARDTGGANAARATQDRAPAAPPPYNPPPSARGKPL